MGLLNSIKQELTHIVEAIHSVINIDITIVDEQLVRLVGTGPFSADIGKKAPKKSAFYKSLTEGKQIFIEEPSKSDICMGCEKSESCRELAELCIPIKYNNKTIGVLGMCAFSEEAKHSFITNRESLISFEHQLSNIISTILKEKNYGIMMEYRSSELTTLINSLNEGIIILNNEHKIITINRYIAKMLGINETEPPPIKTLLTTKIYAMLEAKNFEGEIGPVVLNGHDFIISACPIFLKNVKKGLILLFSDYDKMRDSVYSVERNKDIATFDDIIGESELLIQARRQAMQIAGQDVAVLLTGETGTGKEIFAQAIHSASQRKNDVFFPINCGAIPENLIESELFGYEKGAFTGASKTGQQGKFEICKNGTLFLDEIGDLPLPMQVKLLRALESKQITRVGGHTFIKVNPRIISATSKDLRKMVEEKTFREDLFYRLNIVPINIPPLRERGYDTIVLARYFLQKFNKIYNKDIKGLSSECENILMRYHFPGNIRELRNLIEYAVIFEEASLIKADTIRSKLREDVEEQFMTLAEMTRQYEKSVIERHLKQYGNTLEAKRKIARHLGISIATLYRKLGEIPPAAEGEI